MNRTFAELNRLGQWCPKTNGAMKRSWFAYNVRTKEYHYNRSGILQRYSMEGAVRKCNELNGKPA